MRHNALEQVGLFDMDGSLADYEGTLRADMAKLAMPGDPDLTNMWAVEKEFPAIAARMNMIKAQPNWWLNLPPIKNGMRVFREARRIGFTNAVLTKGPSKHPLAWGEKLFWCREHLGATTQVTVTENKGLVYGKFLYDDFPDYAIDWLEHRPRGLVIMPETENNKTFSHPQVLKWNGENWGQVREALRRCYRRKVGEPMVIPT